MDSTQLQIIVSAVNEAADQLAEVSEQLTGLGTTASEASEQISSSLTAAEEAAADAAIATATQWDDSLGEVSAAVSEATTAASSSFSAISESSLAAANSMAEGWQASIAELQETMAQADAEIVAGATTAGEEAGTAAGEGFGGYFKKMIVGYALEQVGSFLSGGVQSLISAASSSTDKINTLTAQIQQQKASIAENESALQKWYGTTAEVSAAHQKAAANIETEKAKITDLTQQVTALQQGQQGLPGQIHDIEIGILGWLEAHKQLETQLQTFMTTLGPILNYIGEAIIVLTLLKVALSVLDGPLLILIALGIVVALLAALWQTFHTQITNFLNDLDAKTGIITTFKDAWHSIVTEYDNNLKPALQQLWTALQPLAPYIKDLAEVAFFLLIKEIEILVPIIVGLINGFVDLLTIATKIETFFVNQLVGAIHLVGDALNAVFNSPAFKAVGGLLGSAGSLVNSIGSAVGGAVKAFASGGIVNSPTLALVGEAGPEAIIPLSAFSGGSSLAGGSGSFGGGGIVVNITGGYYLDQNAAQQIGNALATSIGRQLKLKNFV